MKKILSVMIVLCVMLSPVCAFSQEQSAYAYAKALETYEAGLFEEAEKRFLVLNEYENAQKYAVLCRARLLTAAGEFEQAQTLFAQMGDFELANAWLLYAQAEMHLKGHALTEAMEAYAGAALIAFSDLEMRGSLVGLKDALTERLSYVHALSQTLASVTIGEQTREGIEICFSAPGNPEGYLVVITMGETTEYPFVLGENASFFYKPKDGGFGDFTVRAHVKYGSTDGFSEPVRRALTAYNGGTEDREDFLTPLSECVQGVYGFVPAAPEITGIEQTESGVKIAWSESAGAEQYALYRHEGDTVTCIFEGGDALEYTDTEPVYETEGIYTVTASCEGRESAHSASASIWVNMRAPVLKPAEYAMGQVQFSWNSVPGASVYKIFRAGTDGNFAEIGLAASTEYADGSAEKGQVYMYAVAACSPNGEEKRSNIVPVSIPKDLAAPVLTKAELASKKIALSWTPVSGAEGYRVYRSQNGGAFLPVCDTFETHFEDEDIEYGAAYTYRVAALASWCGEIFGKETQIEIWEALERPVITYARYADESAHLAWNEIENAKYYTLFRICEADGRVESVYNGGEAAFTDQTVKPGNRYFYFVRAVSVWDVTADSEQSEISTYTVLKAPVLSADDSQYRRISMNWSVDRNAERYQVYRSDSPHSLGTLIYETQNHFYVDEAPLPEQCYYTVVALNRYQEEPAASNTVRVNVKTAKSIAEYTGDFIADASSYRKNNRPDVSAARLIDGDLGTSWDSMNERQGAWVYLSVTEPGMFEFNGFTIHNGKNLGPDERVTDSDTYWHKNCRVREILVYVDDRFVGAYLLSDIRAAQEIAFAAPVEGTSITFRIASVYQGTKYNDTCITEIELW